MPLARHRSLAFLLGGIALGWAAGPGCASCDRGAPDVSSTESNVVALPDRSGQTAVLHDLELQPVAVVLRSGGRSWMWVDGRSSAVAHPTEDVRWSPQGFEMKVGNGLTKVLAPGGSFYYRMASSTLPDSQPVSLLQESQTSRPSGWSIDYISGAGGKRVQAFLSGPKGRRVRLGLFRQVPDAQIWLEGVLPTDGTPSPPLPKEAVFATDANGGWVSRAPDGGNALDWRPVRAEDLTVWMASVEPFRSDGPPLAPGVAVAADLDRDGADETVLCLDGDIRMLDPRCVLVDIVDGETRMYAVGLPWSSGGHNPVAFTVDGAPYVFMVSADKPSVGFVLRYYGAGWIAEPVR